MPSFYVAEIGANYPHAYAADYPAGVAKLERMRAEDPAKSWELIDCDIWIAGNEALYLARPIAEISETDWRNALECLPPLAWRHADGVERFNMSEFTTGQITWQYAAWSGRYFKKQVRHGDAATYLTAAIVSAVPLQSATATGI